MFSVGHAWALLLQVAHQSIRIRRLIKGLGARAFTTNDRAAGATGAHPHELASSNVVLAKVALGDERFMPKGASANTAERGTRGWGRASFSIC